MKINVMNNGVPHKGREWHLNPATVCMAERRRCEDGSLRYLLHTMDGGVWEVSKDSYERVLAWMETHE